MNKSEKEYIKTGSIQAGTLAIVSTIALTMIKDAWCSLLFIGALVSYVIIITLLNCPKMNSRYFSLLNFIFMISTVMFAFAIEMMAVNIILDMDKQYHTMALFLFVPMNIMWFAMIVFVYA